MIWKNCKVLWFGMYARLRDFIWLQGCVIYYGTLRDVIVTKNVVCLSVFFKFPEISTISFKFKFIQYNKIVWTKFFISTVTVLSFQVPGRISSTAMQGKLYTQYSTNTDFISQNWTIHPMNAPAPSIEIYVRCKFENIPKVYKRFGIARTIMGILGRCKIRRINVANNFKSSLKPTTLLVSTVIFIFPIFYFILFYIFLFG